MKIFCVGRNYAEHAKELNNPIPKQPLIFSKPLTALLRSGKPFFYPEFSTEIHYEVELVLKICKNGKYIAEKFAHKYYNEITVGVDLTARDIQRKCKAKGHPWEIAKGFDGSAPIGKFIPISQIDDVQNINFSLVKNGKLVQQGTTKDLLFSFDKIISYISQYFTVQCGDLIYTGTPAGVGEVKIGDTFAASIGTQKLLDFKVC